jgi:DNA invertase Pin-like site-specific DNA recombinase
LTEDRCLHNRGGLIRERTLAGLAAARSRGRVGGRPSVIAAAKLRQARRMHTEGVAPGEIAKVLGVGRATVYRHLQAGQEEDTPIKERAHGPVAWSMRSS